MIVALCRDDRGWRRARSSRRLPGVDFAIVGAEVGDGMAEAEPVGDGGVSGGAGRSGRRAARVELQRRAARHGAVRAVRRRGGAHARARARRPKRIADAEGAARRRGRRTRPPTRRSWRRGRRSSTSWSPRERDAGAGAMPPPPATGNWFTLRAGAGAPYARRAIPTSPSCLKRLGEDRSATANFAAAQEHAAAVAEAGQADLRRQRGVRRLPQAGGRVLEETVHAQAWKTLVERRQAVRLRLHRLPRHRLGQAGRQQPRHAEKRALRDVQCETCHGPGVDPRRRGGAWRSRWRS